MYSQAVPLCILEQGFSAGLALATGAFLTSSFLATAAD